MTVEKIQDAACPKFECVQVVSLFASAYKFIFVSRTCSRPLSVVNSSSLQ